jgi:hypothetical protein
MLLSAKSLDCERSANAHSKSPAPTSQRPSHRSLVDSDRVYSIVRLPKSARRARLLDVETSTSTIVLLGMPQASFRWFECSLSSIQTITPDECNERIRSISCERKQIMSSIDVRVESTNFFLTNISPNYTRSRIAERKQSLGMIYVCQPCNNPHPVRSEQHSDRRRSACSWFVGRSGVCYLVLEASPRIDWPCICRICRRPWHWRGGSDVGSLARHLQDFTAWQTSLLLHRALRFSNVSPHSSAGRTILMEMALRTMCCS